MKAIQGKSYTKNVRMSPTKIRMILNHIKGSDFRQALMLILLLPKGYKAQQPILKALWSALANLITAHSQDSIDLNSLYLKEARVDQGRTMKRFRPRAQGRAAAIQKKTSHITIVLASRETN